jgi:hypothetical protein
MSIHGDRKGAIAYDMKTLDMSRQHARVPVDLMEPPIKQQKTTAVATMTLATPNPKDTPKDHESSKATTARAKTSAPLAQEPRVTANESHKEDDELDDKLAKTPTSTPQAKETQDDASTKKVALDPRIPPKLPISGQT